MFISPNQVSQFLKRFKALVSEGEFLIVRRQANIQGIIDIGLTLEGCKQEILDLSIENYSSGPEPDRDYPGDIWVFGKDVLGQEVYFKLKIDEFDAAEQAVCISLHPALHPLDYPLKDDT